MLALPLLTAAQYPLMDRLRGEFYPAVVGPSFAGRGAKDGAIATKQFVAEVTFADGRVEPFSRGEFFVAFPDSHRGRIFRNFRQTYEDPATRSEARAWLATYVRSRFGQDAVSVRLIQFDAVAEVGRGIVEESTLRLEVEVDLDD
jgi:hypothetical protein